MAFPTTSVLEAFTAGNGTAIGSLTSWGILSGANDGRVNTNQASNVGASGAYVGNYRDDQTYGADSEAYITVATKNDYQGVYARLTSPTGSMDGYQASWAASSLTLQRYDNGAATQLGAAVTLAQTNGNKLGLECIGSTIKVYVDTGSGFTERASRSDATYGTAGNIGFDLYDVAGLVRLDDFGGGTVVGGGGGPVAPRLLGLLGVGT